MADPEVEVGVDVKEEISKDQVGTFDPSRKKKKKKVRIVEGEEPEAAKASEKPEELPASDVTGSDESFTGKKKKKKEVAVGEAEKDEGESSTSVDVGETQADVGVQDEAPEELDDADLSFTKKKKKPKQRSAEDKHPVEEEPEEEEVPEVEEGDIEDDDDEEAEAIDLTPQLAWEGTDRDYIYEELLDRVFNILRENNPELAGEKRRTIMRPPQVLREGTKKTVFVNFMDLCKTMHRQPEHVMAFLLAELGTSGSLDGQQRLVVKGRFAPKNFEGILRRYVNEYVMCSGCKSPDTILSKENRLFFLRCEQCGSVRSVAPIKAGFVARVGRRKATT